MKKTWIFTLTIIFACALQFSSSAQLGGMLNKMKSKIVDKALGTDSAGKDAQNEAAGKEPDCASDNAVVVFPFDKGFDMKKSEVSVFIQDGNVLLFSKLTGKYFIKNKNTADPEGPFDANDPEVKKFVTVETSSGDNKDFSLAYPEFITRTGEMYLIKFGGKSYGPYAVIQNFVVSSLKTKFLAQVTPEVMFSEKDGAQMEKEANKAQTMEQKMELAKKIQDKMMGKMTGGANPQNFGMQLVSNLEGLPDNMGMMAMPSVTVKFDEIVWIGTDKIMDISGKTIFTFDRQTIDPQAGLWLSSDNKQYATYNYGLLKLNEGQECNEVFSPFISKENGQTVLNYLYYSPKNNAIMQLSTPF